MTMVPPPPAYSRRANVHRHPDYYFEDGNLSILISDTLFRLWTGHFRAPHSRAFEKMYPALAYTDDDSPLRLAGITAREFEKLLWVLYPLTIGEFSAETVDDWLAVLKLSTLWEFAAIRKLAIKRLGSLPIEPVRKIVVQKQYDIEKAWAFDAFNTLCRRCDPPTVREGRDLGVDVLAKVAQTREKLAETWGKGSRAALVRDAWAY